MLNHLYPHAKKLDNYIHAHSIGCEETSNKGMMLTNAGLLEILGLLTKKIDSRSKFDLCPNAKKRCVFLYNGALSVSLHSALYDKILRQIT
jgi:hypothetical protein